MQDDKPGSDDTQPKRQPKKGDMMSFLNVRTPFFRPLWRRILATVICLGWALYELSSDSVFWAILFGAAGAHLAWQFFFLPFEEEPKGDKEKG